MSDLPEGTVLGELTIETVLFEYDGSRLFLARNDLGARYLAVRVEGDSVREVFLYVPVSRARAGWLLDGTLSVRDAVTKARSVVWVVEAGAERAEWHLSAMNPERIPEEYLPADTRSG